MDNTEFQRAFKELVTRVRWGLDQYPTSHCLGVVASQGEAFIVSRHTTKQKGGMDRTVLNSQDTEDYLANLCASAEACLSTIITFARRNAPDAEQGDKKIADVVTTILDNARQASDDMMSIINNEAGVRGEKQE